MLTSNPQPHALHYTPRQCPSALQPIAPHLEHSIHRHVDEHMRRLAAVTACDSGHEACPTWWLQREAQWRARAASAMQLRLCTHARLWRDFLPLSHAQLGKDLRRRNETSLYEGAAFSALDYWEAEYSCGDEERVPQQVGDGPKWVCGAAALHRPCTVLSLGSNLDDSFERAMHARADCRAHIVDPTLDMYRHRETPEQFAVRLAAYGATLNASVGVGNPNSTGMVSGPNGRSSFRLVSLSQLLQHQYGPPPWHLTALKMDIEGHERGVLPEVFSLCAEGKLQIDQMNVELHPWPAWYGAATFRTFRDLFAVMTDALNCGLVLHHKERNLWGCPQSQCMELAWVSLRHAKRSALASVGMPADGDQPHGARNGDGGQRRRERQASSQAT